VKKSSTLFGSLLFVSLLFSNVFPQAPSQGSRPKTSVNQTTTATTSKPVNSETIENDVDEALTLIQNNYVGAKSIDYNELFKSSIESMLHTLDPHSNYFDAKETEEFRTEQRSEYYGIGATISDLRDAKGDVIATFVKATFENSPANRAGLRYGDKFVEINGTSMLGKTFTEVRKSLLGPQGTVAKITVERFKTGKFETVEITRDAVSQPSIPEVYMIRPGVGYIAMTSRFSETTFAEFRKAMEELKSLGMQQLVLDLRNNGGGLVREAVNIANTFLSRGQTIMTQKGRLGDSNEVRTAINPNPDDTPIVMLVNRNTASASEILAGALQDHDRVLIVGENTFGKGLVQNPFAIEDGSMLLLTIAKYLTPSGRLIQRDYSNGNLYDYYTNGGTLRDENQIAKPTGEISKTDSGRAVYGGGGINPDVAIKPQTITNEKARQELKLNDPIFAFALELVYGKIAGFDAYQAVHPITFEYTLKSADYQITDNLIQQFKKFAAEKYKIPAAQIDKEREFVERTLRAELVTATYGSTTSIQVYNEYDNQLLRAIELLPQAKQLAIEGAKANLKKSNAGLNQ
jgi:carboxyl-terminal processing protease